MRSVLTESLRADARVPHTEFLPCRDAQSFDGVIHGTSALKGRPEQLVGSGPDAFDLDTWSGERGSNSVERGTLLACQERDGKAPKVRGLDLESPTAENGGAARRSALRQVQAFSDADAESWLAEADRQRSEWIHRHYGADWEDPAYYDLIVRSDRPAPKTEGVRIKNLKKKPQTIYVAITPSAKQTDQYSFYRLSVKPSK